MSDFSEPTVNVIQHRSGFSVKVLGRTGILYSEQDRTMHVDSEVLASPGMAIYVKSIRAWDPPYQDVSVTPEDSIRIVRNICAAIAWKGESVEVVG